MFWHFKLCGNQHRWRSESDQQSDDQIAERIETRYTPRLRFELDAGVKHSLEIARVLGEVLPPESPAPPSHDDTPQEDA